MSKIIIHIEDGISDNEAMENMVDSIRAGKVSETNGIKHYCHEMSSRKTGIHVRCESVREGLYTFKVWRVKARDKVRGE